jgi:hypothetical protein
MLDGPIDRVLRYPVWLGLVLLSVGFTIHYLGVQSVRNLGGDGARLFGVTTTALDLTPDPGGGELFGAQLFVGALRMVYGILSMVGLLLTVAGLCSVVVGLAVIRRQFLGRAGRRLTGVLTDPGQFVVLVGSLALVAGVLTNPLVRGIVVNTVTFTAMAAPVFFLSLAAVVSLERRSGPVTSVLVVWPLAVGTLFLSVVTGTFASPATAALVRQLTGGIVRFLLLNLFSIGGLNDVLVRVFELEGVGFLAFWAGVDAVVGVTLGLASRRYRAVSIEAPVQWVRDALTGEPDRKSAR